MSNLNELIIYRTDDGLSTVRLHLENDTVWLNQQEIAELFQSTKQNVSKHIRTILQEGEISKQATVNQKLTVQNEGDRQVQRKVAFYALPMILAVGYRVRSARGTQFRQWATERLSEYLVKGFTMDDERLKGSGGGDYWKELLERIRDIRSSEKALYRQVLDLYATSQDYNPNSAESIEFFKIVQNKLHYAASEHTAAELIYKRADATKDFMGLTTFQGALPTLKEATVAKNYLTQDELFRLNRLVSAFFDLAELKAQEHTAMTMRDWVAELNKFSGSYGKGALPNAGSISHEQAMKKAEKEYRTYQARTLSPVEEAYLASLKALGKKVARKAK